MKKKQTLEEFINSQPYYGHCTTEYLEGIEVGANWQEEQAKEMENEQRQKKENQFVLNMPFDIQPLTKEVEMSSPSHKQELVIGYVIKDAKGVEYYFYEEDGVLKYDGWSADLPTTKTEE